MLARSGGRNGSAAMGTLVWAALLALSCGTATPRPEAAAAGRGGESGEAARSASPSSASVSVVPAAPEEFRQEPPAAGKPLVFHAPAARELKLKNGLPVFFIERHELPIFSAALVVRSGKDSNPEGRAGLASFAVDMLDEGTATRDAAAIALDFENLAVHYGADVDADSSVLDIGGLAETSDEALAIFADVALHPAFRAADIDRVRVERLGQIVQLQDDPAQVGQDVLGRVIYGDKHPWAWPAAGTVKSLKATTRKDLVDWHARNFVPENAALVVAGDLREPELLAALEKGFGGWKPGKRTPSPKRTAPAHKARAVVLVDKPAGAQSQIWIGELGPEVGASDWFAARIMNAILGGSFNSRLNGSLRTEHAWSYGVFSTFDSHREGGTFLTGGGVVAEHTAEALAEFIAQLKRMQSGDLTQAELDDAKTQTVRALPGLFESTAVTASAFARLWAHARPMDYYSTYQQRIDALGKEDVARAARERLHPDSASIVVVGPREQIEPTLAALGLGVVEVRNSAGEALRAAKAAAKGPAKATAPGPAKPSAPGK